MHDFYIKKVMVHQFIPDNSELRFQETPIGLTPYLDEYFRKKLDKVISSVSKTGKIDTGNPVLKVLSDSLEDGSVIVSEWWRDAFIVTDDQKINDLVFIEFTLKGIPHVAFLRIVLTDQIIHSSNDKRPIQRSQNNLPVATKVPDDGIVINLETYDYFLVEKRIKVNGAAYFYFSEEFLEVRPNPSVKQILKSVEKQARSISNEFLLDEFPGATKVKSELFNLMIDDEPLEPERFAKGVFDNQTAAYAFEDVLNKLLPEDMVLELGDYSDQFKNYDVQKITLSNGIKLTIPSVLMNDSDSIEFVSNSDGTTAISLKNIESMKVN